MEFLADMRVDDGKLRLVEPVVDGRGGQAEVWKAVVATIPEIERAVKLRPLTPLTDKAAFQDLERKAESETIKWQLASRYSLYILNFYGTFVELMEKDGTQFVVIGQTSEFSDIGSIDTATKNGTLAKYINSERALLLFFNRMISGVQAAHGAEIVHCDIKPANFLLFLEGTNKKSAELIPKLGDFGVSVAFYESLQGYTPSYAPPEVLNNQKFSFASDVYSLGLTCLEVLFRTLLNKKDPSFVGLTHKSGEAFRIFLSGVQSELTLENDFDPSSYFALFNAMTAPDPLDRPTLAAISSMLERRRTALEGVGKQYVPAIPANLFQWHPEVHYKLNEALYFVFLKGGMPNRDVKDIKSDLASAEVESYSLHSMAGAWDYFVATWLSLDRNPTTVLNSITRVAATGGHLILRVEGTPVGPRHIKPLKATAVEDMLFQIENLAKDEGRSGGLKDSSFVTGLLPKATDAVRAVLLVSVDAEAQKILPYYADQVKKTLLRGGCKTFQVFLVSDMTVGRAGDVRMLVSFQVPNFRKVREELESIYDTLESLSGRSKFGFSTLFDLMGPMDFASDDGSLLKRVSHEMKGRSED